MSSDVITAQDLPGLRRELAACAANDVYSVEFREVCAEAITAIDQARDGDPDTHDVLEGALRAWVAAGQVESDRCDDIVALSAAITAAADANDVFELTAGLFEILSPEMRCRAEHLIVAAFEQGLRGAPAAELFPPSMEVH